MHHGFSKQLRFEMLEAKRTLTANLTVAVVDGDLIVTGDSGDNVFILQGGAGGGQYEFKNFGSPTDTITTSAGTETFDQDHFVSGVTGDIIINLGAGNDKLNIEGTNGVSVLVMPGDLQIDMGDGDDQIALGMGNGILSGMTLGPNVLPLDVANDVVIDMGAGSEKVWFTAMSVGGDCRFTNLEGDATIKFLPASDFVDGIESDIADDFSVITGGGADAVDLEDINVGDDFSVITGDGADDVNLKDIDVGDDLLVSVGGGDDLLGLQNVNVVGSTLVSLGGDSDSANIGGPNLGFSLTVLGSGTNFINIEGVTTTGYVAVLTASGQDTVILAGVNTGTALVTTGGGTDEVAVLYSFFDYLLLDLGSGDDTLFIDGTTVDGFAVLYGGDGVDTLIDPGSNDILVEFDLAFETYLP